MRDKKLTPDNKAVFKT